MTGIILHEYGSSPFSEKMRICFGIKGLAWSAVDQPVIMPKPDLVPLTGGYRRIPVMQIGADIYCDSALIGRELERRFGGPSLYPAGSSGFASAVEQWCDKGLFQAAVIAIFGTLGDQVDPAFVKDREALSGQPFNIPAMKAMVPFALSQIRAHIALLADHLADGRRFLEGDAPGLADAAAYYNFWFIFNFCPVLVDSLMENDGVDDWYGRVTEIGHGARAVMTPAEAIAIARDAEPAPTTVLPADAELAGRRVRVAATDYGCDPVEGILIGSTRSSVTLRREVDGIGTLAVHFPRLGFRIERAGD
ncbi:MAG: glutathione S-transferase family protein [Novosphingobium sp.]|uniref:glutathione S-transferase family protein n=1 Tax=Novosphingobium sp. TaxID=1874826 RepID=UPI0030183D06